MPRRRRKASSDNPEDAVPGDEAFFGYWPRKQLIAMDERFRARVTDVLAQELDRDDAAAEQPVCEPGRAVDPPHNDHHDDHGVDRDPTRRR
jgi:hypothetical protein